MSDIISQVGKGKRQGVIEAIADTDIGQRVINSPLAKSTVATLKGIASGVAVPTALAIDSVNTGVNAVNGALGGSSELLPTNTTKSVVNWGMGADGSKPPVIAGAPPTPQPSRVQPVNQNATTPVASVKSTPSPPISPAPAIAGGIQKSVGKFGETKFSDGSGGFAMNEQNRLANVAMQDKQAEQIANDQYIANANAIDPIFGMAAQASVTKNNLGKYTADQALASHKIASDATVKAAQIAGDAGIIKSQQAAQAKSGEDALKSKTAMQQKVYDQIIGKYDFTGVSPAAAHEFATVMARTAGQGYTTVKSPDGKSGDLLVHPQLASLFSPERMAAAQKSPQLFQQLLDMAHKAGGGKGIERLPIKNIDQLKLIKTAEQLPTIAG